MTNQEIFEEACQYIPGGVNSPVRAFKSVGEIPVFAKKGDKAHLFGEDGVEYIDYICSWGPLILGHNHPVVQNAIIEASQLGTSFGLPTKLEVAMTKLIVDSYQGIEMVRMVNSGTEATMSALRVARGFTGRNKIIKFEGNYHGHSDGLLVKTGSGALTFNLPTSPGIPQEIISQTIICKYNDLSSVIAAVEQNNKDIAAIILEPVAANMGIVPATKEFLTGLRTLCDQNGIVLIFDEVITGFRVSYHSCPDYLGVIPDMVCFGKIIGGGLPVGAYGGKKEIMSLVSPQGPVYQAGTLSGNPLAMSVGLAQLSYLNNHPDVYEYINKAANYLENGIKTILSTLSLDYQVHRCQSLLTLFFTNKPITTFEDVQTCNTEMYALFFREMLRQGILIAPSQFEAWFVSAAHSQIDLDNTLNAIKKALVKCHDALVD